jgi:hypothetical protein
MMHKCFRSPFPACNVKHRNEAVATDMIYYDVPALGTNGITNAQVFVGHDSRIIDVYGVKFSAQFVNTLLDVIRRRGAMDKLISDNAASEASKRVLDVLRHLMIEQWQSEAHMQHQNFAEHRWQDLKRLTIWLMAYKNVPEDLWLLCLEYVADIMNITAVQSLNWQTPLQRLTGQTPDSSSIAMVFEFYDDVYYRRDLKLVFPSQTMERKKGCFVGFSKDVGHALTYKILTEDTHKILHQSIVRQTDLQPNRCLDPDAALPIPPELALLTPRRFGPCPIEWGIS